MRMGVVVRISFHASGHDLVILVGSVGGRRRCAASHVASGNFCLMAPACVL